MPVDLDVETAKKMYSGGSSLAQIAKQFECESNTVKRSRLLIIFQLTLGFNHQ